MRIKNQSIEICTEMRQDTEVVGKYIEMAITDMVYMVKNVEDISMLMRDMEGIKKRSH